MFFYLYLISKWFKKNAACVVNCPLVIFIENLNNSIFSAHLVGKELVSFHSFTGGASIYEKRVYREY